MKRIALLAGMLTLLTAGTAFSDSRYLVHEGAKVGFIDGEGKIVVSPTYDFAYPFSHGIAAVKRDGLWGYVREDGSILSLPRFHSASPFSEEGYGYVQDELRKGRFLTLRGELLDRPPVRESSTEKATTTESSCANSSDSPGSAFENPSLYVVEEDSGLSGYADDEDEMKIPARFEEAREFTEGLAAVKEGGHWGYIDANGTHVIASRFEDATPFEHGKAIVKAGAEPAIIDRTGKILTTLKFAAAGELSEGLASVQDPTTKLWGFVDTDGKLLIPCRFPESSSFRRGKSEVCSKGFCGLIDRGGRELIPPRFNSAGASDETVFFARRSKSELYFTNDGRLLYSPLNARTFFRAGLYLLPFFLPLVAARIFVRRRISVLKSLEGEPFRVKHFQTVRAFRRIRLAHSLLFLWMLFYTSLQEYFTWLVPELAAAASGPATAALGFGNPFGRGSSAGAAFAALAGIVTILFLFLLTSAALRGSWIRLERQVFQSKLSARRFYLAIARAQLITFLPVIALSLCLTFSPSLQKLGFGITIVYLVLLGFLSPYLFRLANRKSRHKDERLDAIARELGEKSGIVLRSIFLVDDPTGRVSNAFATGLLPRFRRVYVTETLVKTCEHDELRAIIGHELGHMKHHDVAKRVGALLVAIWLSQRAESWLQSSGLLPKLSAGDSLFLWILCFVPLMSVVIGWFSRRAEFRADRYAAELVGDPSIVARALRRIHEESSLPRTFGRWQRYLLGHPSLEEREAALGGISSAPFKESLKETPVAIV